MSLQTELFELVFNFCYLGFLETNQFTATPYIFMYSLPLCVTATPFNHNLLPNGKVILPSLPPLLCGDPELQPRNGIMNALRLAATYESDAERAVFSVVCKQHRRWTQAFFPLIQPFCGPSETWTMIFMADMY
jgi:hypothetical protein